MFMMPFSTKPFQQNAIYTEHAKRKTVTVIGTSVIPRLCSPSTWLLSFWLCSRVNPAILPQLRYIFRSKALPNRMAMPCDKEQGPPCR